VFPFSAAELPALISVPNGESYCFADGSIPYGFGQHWVHTPGAVHLGRIILSPAVRGKGLGRELCQQLATTAVQRTQATTVTLRVYRDNAAAVALYASLGFAPVETESGQDVLFMMAKWQRCNYS
jgi:ribosomal protein S18 acetylase RimI-like enzyme